MAIQLNSNLKIAAPAPIDKRYLSERTVGGSPLPYSGLTEVVSIIPSAERYIGLTVNINNVDYWFKNGVADGNLILKTVTGATSSTIAVTGGTNIGYFSGETGIQTLDLSGFGGGFDGNYYSEYNNYYLDNLGYVRLGSPTYHGALRRAYVNASRTKSWIYSTYTLNPIGWILSSVDVSQNISNQVPTIPYAGTPYSATTWAGFNTNGSNSITATGSLNTGSTLTIGSPVFSDKQYNELRFRTIKSKTPNIIKITNDDSFVYFSGTSTLTTGNNIGGGAQVYSGVTGNQLQFRTIIGTGSTTVTQTPTAIIISSSTGGTTTAANITSGSGIGLYDSKVGSVLEFRSLRGSGTTSICHVGNDVIIYSSGGSGGGTYNLGSPSVIPVGGICSGTVLTGKTAFQLFEELLVPELCGTVTAPSIGIGLSASGLYEIACPVSQTVTGNFSRGSISPQYCSVSPYRSGLPISYCFTGTGMPSGFQACIALTASENNPSYTVVIGTQSWGVCTCYSAGSPALGSKGTQYCSALPANTTSAASNSIIGVYPLWATTSTISTLTKQALQDMSGANNIQVNLVSESSPNKQKFEIPCAWLGSPTSRPLIGVCQWNTVSSQWEYPGGSAGTSLSLWTPSSALETVQGNSIGYCQYTYNGVDRSAVCIRLVF